MFFVDVDVFRNIVYCNCWIYLFQQYRQPKILDTARPSHEDHLYTKPCTDKHFSIQGPLRLHGDEAEWYVAISATWKQSCLSLRVCASLRKTSALAAARIVPEIIDVCSHYLQQGLPRFKFRKLMDFDTRFERQLQEVMESSTRNTAFMSGRLVQE